MSHRVKTALLLAFFLFGGNAMAADIVKYPVGSSNIYRITDKPGGIPDSVFIGDKKIVDSTLAGKLCPSEYVVFLLRTPDENVLLDTGNGPVKDGRTVELLKSMGQEPEKIGNVILTHLHPDHIGGLMDGGKKVFPYSHIYVDKKEYEYWKNTPPAQFNALAKQFIELYDKNIKLFNAGEKIFPWLDTYLAPGHTPGQTIFVMENDGRKYYLGGDIIHCLALQARHPEIAVVWDVDQEQAISARKDFLGKAAKEGAIVLGGHFPGPGAVRFTEQGKKGFSYENIEPEK